VHPYPAQGLEGCPGPLVGRLGDQIFIAERPAALCARSHELEGVFFREIVGAGYQEMVADLALGIRLAECRVPFGESRQRLRVLGTQRAVNRLPAALRVSPSAKTFLRSKPLRSLCAGAV
jgi:hypothetical protein